MTFEKVRLADCCIIKPPKSEARKLLSDEDSVSFVPMNNLGINDKQLFLNEDKALSEVSGSYTYFAENDVLLAKITPCFENGKLGIATGLTNGIGFGSSEFIAFRSKGNIDPHYLYYYLLQPSFRDAGQAVMTGSVGHKRVPNSFIENTVIPLPPIPEQKRIVAILDQVFADIEQARAKTEQNLKNTRELFESYLQEVFSQQGDESEYKTLEEVSLDFGRGKSKHRPRNDTSLYGGKYPFIQTGDVRNCEHIISDFTNTYNEKGLAQSKLWPKGTICITIAANIAETGILGFDSCFPDSIIGVVVNPKITTVNYIEFLLQSFKVILQAKGKGSAQDNINMGTFENMKFPFPSLGVQNDIVKKLNILMISVQQLEEIYRDKLSQLEELKKSILQKAFTGQLTNKKSQKVAA